MRYLLLLALAALLLGACGATAGGAGQAAATAGDMQVSAPWARPAAGGSAMEHGAGHAAGDDEQAPGDEGAMDTAAPGGNSAAYMRIQNTGDEPDRLLSVASDVAATVELHMVEQDGDVMKMRPVEGGIEVPAGGEVELKPGGYHVMLIGVTRELAPGDTIDLTLQFERAGALEVQATVREP